MAKKIFTILGVLLFIVAIYAIVRETITYEIVGKVHDCEAVTYKDGNGYVEDKWVVIKREDGVKVKFRNDDDLICLEFAGACFCKRADGRQGEQHQKCCRHRSTPLPDL